jgi:hypothetical protein
MSTRTRFTASDILVAILTILCAIGAVYCVWTELGSL